MTPHQKHRIDDAFKQGVDALRFIGPHLECGNGISEECAQYLAQKQAVLAAIIKVMPTFVPAPRFCSIMGYYVEADGRMVDV